MRKVWIAGPRAWENPKPVDSVVATLTAQYGIANLLILHGGAPGVDTLVEKACEERNVHTVVVKPRWPVGRKAGPIRNRVIAKELEPELLVALHYMELNQTNHRGTQSAIRYARAVGAPVKVLRVKPEVAMPSIISSSAPGAKRRAKAAKAQKAGTAPKRKAKTG